jgi:hypothetical protein
MTIIRSVVVLMSFSHAVEMRIAAGVGSDTLDE